MTKQTDNFTLPYGEQSLTIENRNYLSPIGFRLVVQKMRAVDFFCQSASVPAVTTGFVKQPTRFNMIPQPGDELYYDNLVVRFLVDENMKNYYQVHEWMRKTTTPVESEEFTYSRGQIRSKNQPFKVTEESPITPGLQVERASLEGDWGNQWKSDVSLFILSSNYQPVSEFIFRDAFPISLTTLNFNASTPDINYFTAEVRMAYTNFDPVILPAATATDTTMPRTDRVSALGVPLGGAEAQRFGN